MSDLRTFRREAWGLNRVLFAVQPPQPLYRKKVFAARDREFERAETELLDAPRNLLVSGPFGIGKTIFVQELVRALNEDYSDEVLAVYECLDNTESDLLTTILRGLASVLKEEDTEADEVYQALAGIERTSQSSQKGGGTGEAAIPGFFKVGGTTESTSTETSARKGVPNAAYQVRGLVERAMARKPERRLVVAVDDLDKRDPATVRAVLQEARSTLHTDCAFVLTGHPMGILRDIYSTVGGVFDRQINLKILPEGDLLLIMRNYLEAGRAPGTTYTGLHPFTPEAAHAIASYALGIPRLLNKICLHILDEAGEMRRAVIDMPTLQECWERAGSELKRMMSEDMARTFAFLHEQTGGFDPTRAPDELYDLLGVDTTQDLLARFNAAMSEDFVIGVERAGRTLFFPQPLLEEPPALPPPPDTADGQPQS